LVECLAFHRNFRYAFGYTRRRGEGPQRGRYRDCLWQLRETGPPLVRLQGAHGGVELRFCEAVKRVGGRSREAGLDGGGREYLRGGTPGGLVSLFVWQQVSGGAASQRVQNFEAAGFRVRSKVETAWKEGIWRQVPIFARSSPVGRSS
jgi:hypothetical protein